MKKLVFAIDKCDLFGDGNEKLIVAISAMENGELLYDDDLVYETIEKYQEVVNPCELQEGYYEVRSTYSNASLEEVKNKLIELGLEWNPDLIECIEEDF